MYGAGRVNIGEAVEKRFAGGQLRHQPDAMRSALHGGAEWLSSPGCK